MMKIEDFLPSHIPGVIKLADEVFGKGYYTYEELNEIQKKSILKGINASKVLVDNNEVLGVRLTKPPGSWERGKGRGLSKDQWPHTFGETAYFQSLFVSKLIRKTGRGKELSKNSIASLKEMGAKGIVCHSWMESPGNGSSRYLHSMGFKLINRWPEYWKEVDYNCKVCGRPCLCTAEEMYLDLEDHK